MSFLVSYHRPADFLSTTAADIEAALDYENERNDNEHAATTSTVTGATTAPVHAATATGSTKRTRRTVTNERTEERASGPVVELRRRRRRNAAGQYILEYEVRPARSEEPRDYNGTSGGNSDRKWLSLEEYEQQFQRDGVVKDPIGGEVV